MLFAPTGEDYRQYRGSTITIGGRRYQPMGMPVINRSLTNQQSYCKVRLKELPPSPAIGEVVPAWVDITYKGKPTTRVFTGSLGQQGINIDANEITLGDTLWQLDRSPEDVCDGTGPLIFSNDTPTDALIKVFTAAGIAQSQLVLPFSIPGDHEVMRVCPVQDICIDPSQNLKQIFEKLCAFLGVAAICYSDGLIRILPWDMKPHENPTLSFENEANYALLSAKRSKDDPKAVVTICIAEGPAPTVDGITGVPIREKWLAADEGVEVQGKSHTVNNQFIQTVPQGQYIAQRDGRLKCRIEQRMTANVMNDMIFPGTSCRVQSAAHHLPEWTPCYIVGTQTNDDDTMSLELSVGLGFVDGHIHNPNEAPLVSFSVEVFAERVLIGGTPTTIYDVYVKDTSQDVDGAIDWENTGTAWSVAGATPLNTIDRTPYSLIVLDTLEGVTVTLTAYDDGGASSSFTQALDSPGVDVLWRRVHGTADGKYVVSNGEEWVEWTAPGGAQVTAVARYNEVGPLWFGCDNGEVYSRSQDDLTQVPVLSTTVSGAVTDIYVGEPLQADHAINHIIVAHGDAVSWTDDGGATWTSFSFA